MFLRLGIFGVVPRVETSVANIGSNSMFMNVTLDCNGPQT